MHPATDTDTRRLSRAGTLDHWIWDGFIPWPGISLLTAASMLGKSTLVGMLLDRRRQGGEILGQRVRPGTTVVVWEEGDSSWARRQQRLDFGPNVFFCRPALPTLRRWRHFIDQLLNLYMNRPFELLVIDSLASFLPAAENHAHPAIPGYLSKNNPECPECH